MTKFKVEASREQKKYTFVFNAENEVLAKEKIHKEWYSILSVSEIDDEYIKWNKFVFEWVKEDEIKRWKVVWDDIFKVYLKLVDTLWYKINYIYPENDTDINLEEKNQILNQLKEQYETHQKWKSILSKDVKLKEKKLEHFYMKKKLEDTYKLVSYVLEKMNNIIEWKVDIHITEEQREKLKTIYWEIVKLKKTTNLSKLKEIWEKALLKIWELELRYLEESKNKSTRLLLKDTNKLLKDIWSRESFVEKSKDIKYLTSFYLWKIGELFLRLKFKKEKNDRIDKESFAYLKTSILLDKYKKRLNENTINIIKNIHNFIFPVSKEKKDKIESILIKRIVIKQNIFILKKKISWSDFSYTKIKDSIKRLNEKINDFMVSMRKVSFRIVLFYSVIFVLYINFSYYFKDLNPINFKWIYYFILLLLLYIITSISRSIFLFFFYFVFLFFIIIFWLVNF